MAVHIQDLGDPDDARRVIDAQQVVADKVTAATAGRPMPQFVLCFSALGFSEAVLKGIKSVVGAVPVFGGTAADNELKKPYEWSQFSSEAEEWCQERGRAGSRLVVRRGRMLHVLGLPADGAEGRRDEDRRLRSSRSTAGQR